MAEKRIGRIPAFLKRNFGKIAYYCAVAVVLAAVALAAEHYRGGEAGEELILPAAELQIPGEKEEDPMLFIPEGMQMIRGYAALPVWNAALSQWETHPATDYIMKDNAVTCLCGGTLRTIGKSGVYGGFVELECGNLLFRYASILPDEGLEAGQEIAAGAVLGKTASGMPGEQDMEDHLHLELYENGESVDFEAYAAKIRQNAD